MTAGLRHLAACVVLVGAVIGSGAGASAAANEDQPISIAVEPGRATVVLGQSTTATIVVSNEGSIPTDPLVVHLDVTDPSQTASVDPEDWTATLTKPVGSIAAGESVTITWEIQPIAPGSFTLYAVAIAPGSDRGSVSNLMSITVADRRSLNPNNILPVALGMPALVGALLLLQRVRARRLRAS